MICYFCCDKCANNIVQGAMLCMNKLEAKKTDAVILSGTSEKLEKALFWNLQYSLVMWRDPVVVFRVVQ